MRQKLAAIEILVATRKSVQINFITMEIWQLKMYFSAYYPRAKILNENTTQACILITQQSPYDM